MHPLDLRYLLVKVLKTKNLKRKVRVTAKKVIESKWLVRKGPTTKLNKATMRDNRQTTTRFRTAS
jgi:hypothetical protein